MSIFVQFDPRKQPRSKIELHVHLDGAVRITTIWELAQKKGISLGVKSLEELFVKCTVQKPSTLANFLKPFAFITLVICGDLDAIERIAYEFCEDSAQQGIIYTEVRYCPHLLCSAFSLNIGDTNLVSPSGDETATPTRVVECVNKGLSRGQTDFKIKVRSILACYRTRPEWSPEILDLCLKFKDQGVVGIDICGDEAIVMATPMDVAVFQQAAKLGIHRTAHAGEAGPASDVAFAVKKMMAERIGHGYHVVEDETIYNSCLKANIHFETCPYSSYLTGSVPLSWPKHPIIRFAEDNANFSLSRDDPFIIQKTLEQDYLLVERLGMQEVHIARANFNAARSCFLPESEKAELLLTLQRIYGVNAHEKEDAVPLPIDEQLQSAISEGFAVIDLKSD